MKPLMWLSASYLKLSGWHFWDGSFDNIPRLCFNVDFGGLVRIGGELKFEEDGLHAYYGGSRATFGDHPIDFKLAEQPVPDKQLSELFSYGMHDVFTTSGVEDMLRSCYDDRRLPEADLHIVPSSWGGQAIWIPISYIKLRAPGRVEGKVYGQIGLDRFISIRDLWLFQPTADYGRLPLLDEILSSPLREQIVEALKPQRVLDSLIERDRELQDYDGIIAGAKPDTLLSIHLGIAPPVLQPA